MNETEIVEVLRSYELGNIRAVQPLEVDPRRPWRVSTDCGEFVLRECRLYGSPEDLNFEHGLSAWLTEHSFPTSRAVATRQGATWLEKGAKFFAVHVYMPGEHFTTGNWKQGENAGRCLAHFHEIASAYSSARTRRPPPGYRTTHSDAAMVGERWWDRDEARWLLEGFECAERALSGVQLEKALLVNDFTTENVVFKKDQVSGVFDLECCFWGTRLIDLADSVLWFSIVETGQEGVAEHTDEFDLACASAFVRGYEIGQPLSHGERGLLPLALRRQIRRWAIYDLVDIQQPGRWNAWEWSHSKKQIDLVDATCDGVVED